MSIPKTIGTHNGVFHCDETLAIALLQELPAWADAKIYRSRDLEFLSTLDLIVDVGDVYDPNSLRFDHHQDDFSQTFAPQLETRLSSAGLIYKHFGLEVLKTILLNPKHIIYNNTPEQFRIDTIILIQNTYKTDNDWLDLYKKIYNKFIKPIDALDNGGPDAINAGDLFFSTLPDRVQRQNPNWYVEEYQTVDWCI